MKQIFALGALLLLCACDPVPGTEKIRDNPNGYGSAYFIGTVDGCRLWSVNNGQFYFAKCPGGPTSTGWTRRVGKSSHYEASATDYAE